MIFKAIPAIDLSEGKVVRLVKGDYGEKTIYAPSPFELISSWCAKGLHTIHLVDLDAAKSGIISEKHQAIYQKIRKSFPNLWLSLGGGIRGATQVDYYFDLGFNRLVIGTLASQNPNATLELIHKYNNKLYIGIDQRGNKVATKGWLEQSTHSLEDLLEIYNSSKCSGYIFTDIQADGTLDGVDVQKVIKLAKSTKHDIIIAGGVANSEDIRKLRNLNLSNLTGVIVGKALHENIISLKEVLDA